MLILVTCIDGQNVADLAAGLRETLRLIEAGQLAGQHSDPEKSYHFNITPVVGISPSSEAGVEIGVLRA